MLRTPEKPPGAVQNEQVIDERRGSDGEKEIIGGFRNYCTSRIRIDRRRSVNSKWALNDSCYGKSITKKELFRCPRLWPQYNFL
jgi:hypothetical protein